MKIAKILPLLTLVLGLSCSLSCGLFCILSCAHGIDLAEVEKKLTTGGVEGEVHGAHSDLGLFVFTYRNPENFFDFIEMSLVGENEILEKLQKLSRHDRIKVVGKFMKNRSPQKHIEVKSLEIIKKYQAVPEILEHHYEAKIPEDLIGQTTGVFLVHAVHAEGKILVVEYKDAVIPIFVKNGELTKHLARNDVVKLEYKIQTFPDRPLHLNLNEKALKPVEVLDGVMALHQKPADKTGALVLFPKSPQVAFNVFALLEELPSGLKRQYTLANFESSEEFKKIRLKLQAAWDAAGNEHWISGRNKLISTKVKVRAQGIFNEVDPNQANVQILLKGPEDITIHPAN